MYRTEIWQAWDAQENARLAKLAADEAYRKLNSLFLKIERKERLATGTNYHELLRLARLAYEKGDFMVSWWISEIDELFGIEL